MAHRSDMLQNSFAILAYLTISIMAQSQNVTVAESSTRQPDLQGMWSNKSATPLQRPKQLESRPFLTDQEVDELKQRANRIFKDGRSDLALGDTVFMVALANPETYRDPEAGGDSIRVDREFDNRTSLIIDPPDGKLPAYTPAGKQRWADFLDRALATKSPASPSDFTLMTRCITFGVPRISGPNGAGIYGIYQIVQTPNYVVFFTEAIHEARVIPLDGRPHLSPGIRTWLGDSRGRWEGSTLVVDTTNFSSKANFLGASEDLHLIEFFTRISPDEIRYEVRVEARDTWVRPWTAMVRLKRTDERIFEYSCHENNAPIIESMLSAARSKEK